MATETSDLAVANHEEVALQLFHNVDGAMDVRPAWSSVAQAFYLGTLAWGDYDSDGDPDLAAQGGDGGVWLFENNSGN
ncbi:MAG: hypothetical protein IPK16_01620 [Anaerolineales bacterium]|nr:hypothetical protein [Anaerolineales bacterium]